MAEDIKLDGIKLDPHVKELLRNADIENKTEGDPVTQLEQSSTVTEGEIKNDLNIKSTQQTVQQEADNASAKIDDVEKPKTAAEEYLQRLEERAKQLGISVGELEAVARHANVAALSVGSNDVASKQEKDAEDVKKAIGVTLGAMGALAGVAIAGEALAKDSGNRSAPSPFISLLAEPSLGRDSA